jgi:crotonobetainyl-CoA:carnitine CoA-transferase CaiB-like acyl-CoA transferase
MTTTSETFDPGKPLAGLLVVSLEQAVAAPYCSSRLADAGARVIKIECAEGDFARGYDSAVNGLATYFVWLNRGKEASSPTSSVLEMQHYFTASSSRPMFSFRT